MLTLLAWLFFSAPASENPSTAFKTAYSAAIADLSRALEQDPTRLDVHFGLIAVLRMADRRAEVEPRLMAMLAMVAAHPAKQLKWLEGKPLKEPVATFVPLNVISAIDLSDFEYLPALRVLEARLAQYPKCGECWNARAQRLSGRPQNRVSRAPFGDFCVRESVA